MPVELGMAVPALLRRSPLVTGVELRGSRAAGTAGPFSDWDFAVSTEDFVRLASELPDLVIDLHPLVQQWDRLSEHACYVLIVPGPTKVDLIFEAVPHDREPPWEIDAANLRLVDDHFWDWTLWLTSKVHAGEREVASAELGKMHHHLLGPLGIAEPPCSLSAAVSGYLDARQLAEERFGVVIDRRLGDEVALVIDTALRSRSRGE